MQPFPPELEPAAPRYKARFWQRPAALGKTPVISLTAFLVAFALGLVNLGIIFHARDALHASPATIGRLVALWSLGYIVGCLTLGPLLGRFAPRTPAIVSTFVLGVWFASMSMTASVPRLMVLNLGYGVTLSLFWPFLMGWLTIGYEGDLLGRLLNRYNLSWSTAVVISPFVCGWLSERNTRLPIYAATGLVLLAGVLLLVAAIFLPELRTAQHSGGSPGAKNVLVAGRRTRLRFAAWTGLTMTFFGIGVLTAVFPVSARMDFGYSMFMVGNLMLIRSLFKLIGFVWLGSTQAWHFRLGPMLLGHLIGIAGFAGLMWTSALSWVGVSLAACGISGALGYSCSMFHGVSGSVDRSRAMAIHEALLALGMVTGGAFGGALYQAAGMRTVYGVCMGALLIAMLAQTLIGRWATRRDAG